MTDRARDGEAPYALNRVPHWVKLPVGMMFSQSIGLRGGGAPVRTYLPARLDDVLEGRADQG